MRFIARPPGICEPCWSNRVDNWQSDLGFYCPHTRNLVARKTRADEWIITRKVTPAQAARRFAGAVKQAQRRAKELGIRAQDVDALLEAHRDTPAAR